MALIKDLVGEFECFITGHQEVYASIVSIGANISQNSTYLWVFHNKKCTYNSHMNNLIALRQLIGGNIRQLRKSRGWSQEELGEKAELSYKFVGEIERGAVNPSLDSLVGIANALNVEISKLFLTGKLLVLNDAEIAEVKSALAVLTEVLGITGVKLS